MTVSIFVPIYLYLSPFEKFLGTTPTEVPFSIRAANTLLALNSVLSTSSLYLSLSQQPRQLPSIFLIRRCLVYLSVTEQPPFPTSA